MTEETFKREGTRLLSMVIPEEYHLLFYFVIGFISWLLCAKWWHWHVYNKLFPYLEKKEQENGDIKFIDEPVNLFIFITVFFLCLTIDLLSFGIEMASYKIIIYVLKRKMSLLQFTM